jgi:hypothetical protein
MRSIEGLRRSSCNRGAGTTISGKLERSSRIESQSEGGLSGKKGDILKPHKEDLLLSLDDGQTRGMLARRSLNLGT